jgi:MFS family permease
MDGKAMEVTGSDTLRYPGYRWYVLVVLCVLTAASTVVMISPAPLMGLIAKSFHVEPGVATGAMMATFQLALAVSCIAGGFLCDKYGLKAVFLVGSLLFTVPTLVLPLVGSSLPGVVLMRVIQAFGAGPIAATVAAVAALWFPLNQRALVAGLQGAMFTLGVAIGFLTTPAALSISANWQSAIAWQSTGGFVSLLLAAVFAFGPKPPVQSSAVACSPAVSADGDFKVALKEPVTWIGLALMLAVTWIFQGFNDLTPGYFALDKPVGVGYGPMTAGKLMSLVQIAFVIGSISTGFILEKVFRGRVRPVITMGYALFAIFAFSIIFHAIWGNMSVLPVCLVIAGFFIGLVGANVIAFASKKYPAHIAGKLVGMWMGIGLFGGFAGIMAGATALHNTGNYHASIVIVCVIAVIGLVFAQFLKSPRAFPVSDRLR